MSRLAELLKQKDPSANPANPANPSTPISSISKISKGVSQNSHLNPDLEQRIRAMAARWRFSEPELAQELHDAAQDPERWLQIVTDDEALHHAANDPTAATPPRIAATTVRNTRSFNEGRP